MIIIHIEISRLDYHARFPNYLNSTENMVKNNQISPYSPFIWSFYNFLRDKRSIHINIGLKPWELEWGVVRDIHTYNRKKSWEYSIFGSTFWNAINAKILFY